MAFLFILSDTKTIQLTLSIKKKSQNYRASLPRVRIGQEPKEFKQTVFYTQEAVNIWNKRTGIAIDETFGRNLDKQS